MNAPVDPTWSATLSVLHDELIRQRAALQAKKSSMDTKAALLITGAGILAGLVGPESTGMIKAAAVVALAAAIFGLLALWPLRGTELKPESFIELWSSLSPADAENRIFTEKADVHRRSRFWFAVSGTLVQVGFTLLVVAAGLVCRSLLIY